jgi:hypothetical protein
MENSSSIRRRKSRNARESTPEPNRTERVAEQSETTKLRSNENVHADESKYIVRGILNVGPPSPAGSISSSSSGSGHGASTSSGSHAYRAKILRYS